MTSTTESGTTILKTDTRGRVWTPKADREALLDLFEQGGMSGAAFARLHGLRYPTFAHWWKRRRERREREEQGPVALFQEVVLDRSGGTRNEGLEIELPLGAKVRLERADQIPLVAALCRHLRECAPRVGGG